MPKFKSNSGAKKRVRLTGTGRLKRKKAYHSHILTKKSQKRKRNLRKATLVSASEEKNIKMLVPYL
ncbi:MAG TPA: 50S ribosomal protein L35 [Bacteroidetes bacterium]|nr:50S ribosomal protein L35 [Bacteroidota bacterium]